MFKKFLLVGIIVSLCGVGYQWPAFSEATYSIKEMTPEVQGALENRRARYEDLRQLKNAGAVGENNQGYVEALSADAQAIVSAENTDRKVIYVTIAQQNNLQGALATIEKVFAQVQRDKAEPGDKIQEDNGTWTTK